MLKKMNEKLSKWVTPKSLAVFLTIVYVAGLVPLLWIGWYNYPSADDYTIGLECRQAWGSTHNLFAVLWAGVLRAVEDWITWMGYFTSNFFMAIPPQQFWREALCSDGVDHAWDVEFINHLSVAEYICQGL